MADTAVGLMLMTVRGFGAAERYARAGRWFVDGPYPLTQAVTGSRVGILGLGHIGSAIAHRLTAFNCVIAYHNRHELPGSGYRYAPSAVDLAKSVEVLVVATTGGKDAPPLVSRDVLEALGPDGYLINIARGSVVDEQALVELLAQGRLAGAGPRRGRPRTGCAATTPRDGQRRRAAAHGHRDGTSARGDDRADPAQSG